MRSDRDRPHDRRSCLFTLETARLGATLAGSASARAHCVAPPDRTPVLATSAANRVYSANATLLASAKPDKGCAPFTADIASTRMKLPETASIHVTTWVDRIDGEPRLPSANRPSAIVASRSAPTAGARQRAARGRAAAELSGGTPARPSRSPKARPRRSIRRYRTCRPLSRSIGAVLPHRVTTTRPLRNSASNAGKDN